MAKRKAAKKPKPNGRAGPPVLARAPRQPNLPGTDDRAIRDLEDTAQQLVDLRRQGAQLQDEIGRMKGRLLNLMRAHGKRTYQRKGIVIDVVAENETVKVRVHKSDDAGVEDAAL